VGSRARDICLSQLTDGPLPILENRTRMAGICLPLAGDKYIHFLPDSWLPFRQVQLSVAKKGLATCHRRLFPCLYIYLYISTYPRLYLAFCLNLFPSHAIALLCVAFI